jgi:hypothetical protein
LPIYCDLPVPIGQLTELNPTPPLRFRTTLLVTKGGSQPPAVSNRRAMNFLSE